MSRTGATDGREDSIHRIKLGSIPLPSIGSETFLIHQVFILEIVQRRSLNGVHVFE